MKVGPTELYVAICICCYLLQQTDQKAASMAVDLTLKGTERHSGSTTSPRALVLSIMLTLCCPKAKAQRSTV